MKRRKQVYDFGTDVRAIARERVGSPRPRIVMVPKIHRKPKYAADLRQQSYKEIY